MSYKAVIFDMDGTILSSEAVCQQATKQLLKNKAHLTEEACTPILEQLKGASSYTTCTFIKMMYGTKESVEELVQEKDMLAQQLIGSQITFIDGFQAFHTYVTQLGFKTAIATNTGLTSLARINKIFNLSTFFKDHIYSIDHVHKISKPEPDIFLYAAQQLEIEPEHCIVIEDSAPGIAAAKAAHMFCIGINTGNDRNTLVQADMIVDHYNEINIHKIPFKHN